MIDKSKVFAEKTDIEALRRSITTFYASEGRYPKDMEELEGYTGVPMDKSTYDYDPSTGKLSRK
ncbi:MAG: type II secretion system protein GspG [Nitrospirae bacterium]|nr:type II secretion system protein GspG [Nitrospirota bacterium]